MSTNITISIPSLQWLLLQTASSFKIFNLLLLYLL